MINYKLGNLIQAAKSGEVNVIAHCCNVYNTMGSGIAPQIKFSFPEAYAADCETEKGDFKKLGTYTKALNIDYEGAIWIYNLYGQGGYFGRNKGIRDLDYNAIYDALSAMTQDLKSWKGPVNIGLPLIGCGLAGGNWNIVSSMIEETLCYADFNVTVYIRKIEEAPQSVAMQLLVDYCQENGLYQN